MQISNIETSLQYGRHFLSKGKKFLYFIMALCLCVPLASLMVIIQVCIGYEKWNQNTCIFIIAGFVVGFLLLSYPISLIICNKRLEKKMSLWLDDAIQLKAYSKILDKFRVLGQPFAEVKLQVSFVYKKNRYVRISGDGKRRSRIYQKVFAKYADREINILYSPKYDQVMILKEKLDP